MYKKQEIIKTSLKRNTSIEGETIEQKIERIVNNKEPITDGAPPIYTERKDGVIPAYDIRTDRFEIAIDALTVSEKQITAKREARAKEKETGTDGKPESTQGQEGSTGGQTTTE